MVVIGPGMQTDDEDWKKKNRATNAIHGIYRWESIFEIMDSYRYSS